MASSVEEAEVLVWEPETFDEEEEEEEEEQEEPGPNAAQRAGLQLWSATAACRDCGFGIGGSSPHRIVTESPPPFF